MDPGSETTGAPGEYAGLHFIDGTSSQRSYAARAKLVAMWMLDQLKPSLAGLKKAADHQKIVLAAQKEFAELVEGQVEVVGPHLQQLDTIYHKHHQ
jgi:hypothetical protein